MSSLNKVRSTILGIALSVVCCSTSGAQDGGGVRDKMCEYAESFEKFVKETPIVRETNQIIGDPAGSGRELICR